MDAKRQAELRKFETVAWDGTESIVRVAVYDDPIVVAAAQEEGARLVSPGDPYIDKLPAMVKTIYSQVLPPLCSACDNEVPRGKAHAFVVIVAGREGLEPAMGGCLCKDCTELPVDKRAAAVNSMLYGSPCTGVFPV